ncbi:hypothetical protein ON010_g18264 [Phytophthora cinnamomi]|nr:hypothetical protein ON010_g18264 [Phytophthora cinnamomi]
MPYGVENILYPSPVVVCGHTGASKGPSSAFSSQELAQPNNLYYADDDTMFTGALTLSQRPHHFVGVTSEIELDSVIRFCPVTPSSPKSRMRWSSTEQATQLRVASMYRP